MEDAKYWLGFSLVPEIGPKRIALLRAAFGSLADAWRAHERDLRAAGLEPAPTANLIRRRAQLNLDEQIERVAKVGADLIALDDDRYPPLLRTIHDPPPVLYVKGTLDPADERALAIIGTRRATTYGREAAFQLARDCAQDGMTIVSGLAQGIDTQAHRGALQAGRTFAVLGCGIDVMYPRENAALAAQIQARGALISEFPVGTPPDGRHFPRRNRLLSGLSLGVLVVEAPEKSGALITVDFAVEQGRDVFAVPGAIFSTASAGTNRLIQDGAWLVTKAADIVNVLGLEPHSTTLVRSAAPRDAAPASVTRTVALQIVPDNDTEAAILRHLQSEGDAVHVDDLARLCGLPIAAVMGALTMLELKGAAQPVGPMLYRLAVAL